MNPEDSNLDTSLEVDPSTAPIQYEPAAQAGRGTGLWVVRLNRKALLLSSAALLVIAGLSIGGYSLLASKKPSSSNSLATGTSGNFTVGSVNVDSLKNKDPLTNLAQANSVAVNGELQINKSLVFAPTSAPARPSKGQMYYDTTTNQLYFFNGSTFVSTQPQQLPTGVTALGNATGNIGIGSGLQVVNGVLSLVPGVGTTQAVAAAAGVTSFQGQTGAVTLVAGAGVTIAGTTITNAGVTSVGGASGALTIGRGLTLQSNSIKSTISLVSASSNLLVADDGNGNFTLTQTNNPPGASVELGPTTQQTDISDSVSININKTGLGNFLTFSNSGVDKFVIDPTGAITTGTISYAQVTGAPASTVTSVGGASGALNLGAGLTLIGGDTITNNGVTMITGTANQILASGSTGALTLSLPQDIAASSSPTFTDLHLTGALTVDGLTKLKAGADITGVVNINVGTGGPTNIGNVGGDFSVASTGFNVSTLGNITGVGSLMASGALSAATTVDTLNGLIVNAGSLSNVGDIDTAGGYTQTGNSANSFSGAASFTAAGLALTVDNDAKVTATLTAGTLVVNAGGISTTGTLSVTGSGASNINGQLKLNAAGVALDVTNNATIGGTLAVQGAGGLTIGKNGIDGKLQFTNSTNGNLAMLSANAPIGSGNASYALPSLASGASDTVCLYTLANCSSSPNTVTTSAPGTANKLAKFTNVNTVADSSITDDGTTVSVNATLSAATISTATIQSVGALTINPGGDLSVGGSSRKLSLIGNGSSTFAASSSGSTTTLGFIAPSGNNQVNIPAEAGTLCIQSSVSCGFAAAGSGVLSLNSQTGALTLANASGGSGTITINNAAADGTTKGIAAFNATNFTAASGVINTVQGIDTSANVQFGSLQLNGGDVTLSSSATVYANNYHNVTGGGDVTIDANADVIVFKTSGGATSFRFPTTGGTNQTICTSGIACATGGGQAVLLEPGAAQTAGANATAIFINKNAGTGNILQLQSSGVDALVLDNTGKTIAANAQVTGTLNANTITPTGALAIGATTQQFTLQGDSTSAVTATDAGLTTKVGFGRKAGNGAPVANVNYVFQNDSTLTAGTYYVCTSVGNCSGATGTITSNTGGTSGKIPKFTSGTNIENSIISDNGSGLVTIGGNLQVGISGSSALTLGIGSTASGTLVFNNATNSFTTTFNPATTLTGNSSIQLPSQGGTLAVGATGPIQLDAVTGQISCTTCLTTTTGVVSILGTKIGSSAISGALTLNNALTSGSAITINDAAADGTTKGIATFNATNFSASSGVVNTAQAINTTANPTFNNMLLQGTTGLTVGGNSNVGKITFKDGTSAFSSTFTASTFSASQAVTVPDASGTLALSASGNLALSLLGDVTISNSPTFSTSVSTPLLQSTGALTITPGGALTAGATTQSFLLRGSSASTITATAAGGTTTVSFDAPSQARAIHIPNESGTICLQTSANCGFAVASSVVASLNSLTGALSVANATGAGAVITINNAAADGTTKGIAAFNATNFTAASGVINTVQGISTAATPTFAGATLGSSGLTVGGVTAINAATTVSGTVSVGVTNAAALLVQDASVSPVTVFAVDTSNQRVGIGTGSPSYKLDVSGGSGIVGQFSGRVIGGDAVNNNEFATLGQVAGGSGNGNYIQNGTALQAQANFNVQAKNSGTAGTIAGVLRGAANGQTVDLLQLQDTTGAVLSHFDSAGRLGIGSAAPSYSVDINGQLRLQPTSAPTAAKGVMYFDTTASKFKCSEDGATFANCITSGSTTTLQQTYTNSTGGTTAEIILDSTRGGLDIQDAASTIGANTSLLAVHAGGSNTILGTTLFNVTGNGFVGINAGTAPGNKFSLNTPLVADATATAMIYPTSGSSKGLVIQNNGGQTANPFEVQSNGGVPVLRITPEGYAVASAVVSSSGLINAAANITPTITGGTLSNGGPTYGSPSSAWVANATGQSMTVDLGNVTNMEIISFTTNWRSDNRYMPSSYAIDVSVDGTTWVSYKNITGNLNTNSNFVLNPVFTNGPSSYRYVRLTVNGFQSGQSTANIANFQVRTTNNVGDGSNLLVTRMDSASFNNVFLNTVGNFGIGSTSSPNSSVTLGYNKNLGIELSPMSTISGSIASGGSLSLITTYSYVVQAGTQANGKTLISNELSFTPTFGNQTVNLSWAAVPGASYYNVFRSTTGVGAQNKFITVSATSFTDDGSQSYSNGTPVLTQTALDTNLQAGSNNSWVALSSGANFGVGTSNPHSKIDVLGAIQGGPVTSAAGYATNFISGSKVNNAGSYDYTSSSDRELRIQTGTDFSSYNQYLLFNGSYSGTLGSTTVTQGSFGRFSGVEFKDSGTINILVNTGAAGSGSNTTITPTSAVTILQTARVGINNTNPGFILHVGSSSVTSGTSVARFENAGGTCTVTPNTAGGITCTSDIRLKKDVSPYSGSALDKVLGLNTVSYRLNAESESDMAHTGFIAQDFQRLFPDLVNTDAEGYLSVSYGGLTPYLAKAIQEQQSTMNALTNSVSATNVRMDELLNGNANLSVHSLSVAGPASFAALSVSGDVTVGGNLTIAGHIVTQGDTPAYEVLPAAGNGAVVAMSGNDTVGKINLSTGSTDPVAGDYVKVTFKRTYGKAPNIILTPNNAASAGLLIFPTTESADGFSFSFANLPAKNTGYSFTYYIVE